MSKNKAPAFQFYPKEFITDMRVGLMSAEELGAHFTLICYAWGEGGLPNDHRALARLLGLTLRRFERIWETVGDAWVLDSGKLTCPLIDGFQGGIREERLRQAKEKGRHTGAEWDAMRDAYGVCLACGSAELIEKDHVISLLAGGSDSIRNLQPLCRSCNARKGSDCKDYRLGHEATRSEWLPKEDAS